MKTMATTTTATTINTAAFSSAEQQQGVQHRHNGQKGAGDRQVPAGLALLANRAARGGLHSRDILLLCLLRVQQGEGQGVLAAVHEVSADDRHLVQWEYVGLYAEKRIDAAL